MYCRYCGNQIEDNTAHCKFCGKAQSPYIINSCSTNEPKRLWLWKSSVGASIVAIIFYFITISNIAHNTSAWIDNHDWDSPIPPISTFVPTHWVIMVCGATFFSLMFMIISWAKSKAQIGLNILATILSALVLFIAIMLIANPGAIK